MWLFTLSICTWGTLKNPWPLKSSGLEVTAINHYLSLLDNNKVRSLSGTFIDATQHKAKINDKFEISTDFFVDDGKIKPKKYKLIVVKKDT